MGLVGRGPYRVCYLGVDDDIAEWIAAGFERTDESVEFKIETDPDVAIDRIADAQERLDPRMRSPLVDSEDPFDCVVCTDEGPERDPVAFIDAIREGHSDLPIVLFADDGDETLASRAITAGVTDYVEIDGENPTGRLAERVFEIADDHRQDLWVDVQRERARRVVEENAEMITVVNPSGLVSYQNDTITEALGYDPAEVDDLFPFETVDPDDWQKVREEFYDAVRDPEYVPEVEYRVKDADGEWHTVESRARNLLHDPLIQGFVVTTRDISERKERERDLEGYRRVVENAGDPMYVLDPAGHFKWVNEAFLEHTGYDQDFVEGQHVSTFMREQDLQKGSELIGDLLANDEQSWGRFEFVAENVEGEIRRYEDNVAILTDDDGNLRGSVGVIRELSELDTDD